ncbi:neuropilin and tolloid-like protein 1 [Gigantopelta aegis]|uniref:neuropilin and tolloid-like protein 1 n=1 Tax=Gigantopelta aegis TaxID=1735272 RepID=UPI001B8896CE|nr:neuropilin and tolloid-like protein 1 [Gigantopelta aegis]
MDHISRILLLAQVLQIIAGSEISLVAQNGPLYFYTVGFPQDYHSDTNETWRIRAFTDEYVVNAQVIATNIEGSLPTCQWDNATFFDGDSIYSTRLGYFCGYERPWYTSSGQYMTVRFVSDSSIQRMGFKVKYWCNPKTGFGISSLVLSETEFKKTGAILGMITIFGLFAALAVTCYNKIGPRSAWVHRTLLSNKMKCNKVGVAPM